MEHKTSLQVRTSWLILGVSSVLALTACDIGPITPPVLNQNPRANAGTDQNAEVGQRVDLSGLGSTDANDDPLTYIWEQRSGPNVALDNANSAQASFFAAEQGTYEFALTVTDGQGGSDTSSVFVFVDSPADPTCALADAGIDQTVFEGSAVMLRGCNSADRSGNPLIFDWFQSSGPQVSISAIFTCEPSFVAPQVTGSGDVSMVFELTTTNEDGCPDSDTVVVTIRDRDANDPCNGVVCPDDGLFCNGVEGCLSGACVSNGDPCAAGETCDESTASCAVEPDCRTDSDCDDGVYCNGMETCVTGECVAGTDPCLADETCDEVTDMCDAPDECASDADCDDDAYCNGMETCVGGDCVAGTNPCLADETCNEDTDTCDTMACLSDSDCDDGAYCNGVETCLSGTCVAGTEPCLADETCDEATDMCIPADLCVGVTCNTGETCEPNTGICVANATVLRVDEAAPAGGDGLSWATAFDDIQSALATAANLGGSMEIWVAWGTYTPDGGTGDRNVSYNMLNNVELLGGFAGTETLRDQRDIEANETILSGDLMGDDLPLFGNRSDNSFHILTANGVATTAVLDGFTIRGGNAGDAASPDNQGGALFITNTGTPIVLNCTFRENEANGTGGDGGAIAGLIASSRVENCVFTDNSASRAGGAVVGNSGDFVGCTFTNNQASRWGGAVSRAGGSAFGGSFIDCLFSNNSAVSRGGALNLGGSCTRCTFIDNSTAGTGGASWGGSFANCRFLGNTAVGAGGAISGGGSFVNCEFSGNHAGTDGGAIWLGIPVTNCTFSNNTADRDGGAWYGSGGGSNLFENCVFWNNTDETGATESAQIHVQFGGTGRVFNSLVQGLSVFVGDGNISLNPQFVNPLGSDGIAGTLDDDLRLLSNSPAINKGDNDLVPVDALDVDLDGDLVEKTPLDLDNTARIKGGTVDMGAYEAS